MERREEGVWIRLGLVGKMNEGYFRETNLFLPSYGLFINYMSFFYQLFCSDRTWVRFDKLRV